MQAREQKECSDRMQKVKGQPLEAKNKTSDQNTVRLGFALLRICVSSAATFMPNPRYSEWGDAFHSPLSEAQYNGVAYGGPEDGTDFSGLNLTSSRNDVSTCWGYGSAEQNFRREVEELLTALLGESI